MATLDIKKEETALVVIDLQKGIVGFDRGPHKSAAVVANSVRIIDAFRKNGMPVFLVRVTPSHDGKDALRPDADEPMQGKRAADWAELIPELRVQPSDFVITKRQWGAFYGTELDLELRRRGMTTIVLCGIATDIGVESTARFAFEYGYQQIFAEDAMTGSSETGHVHAVKEIFPRIGKVRTADQIIKSLES